MTCGAGVMRLAKGAGSERAQGEAGGEEGAGNAEEGLDQDGVGGGGVLVESRKAVFGADRHAHDARQPAHMRVGMGGALPGVRHLCCSNTFSRCSGVHRAYCRSSGRKACWRQRALEFAGGSAGAVVARHFGVSVLCSLQEVVQEQCWQGKLAPAWGGDAHAQGAAAREREEGDAAHLALEQQSFFGMGDKEEQGAASAAVR